MPPHTRILVADDDPEVLGAVAEALGRRGAEVVRAESGSDLILRLAEDGPFSLVVTDVSMPWMNGLEVMNSVRCAGMQMPILVMTASKDPRIPDQVRSLGHHARLLRKPFGIRELESAVTDLLEGT